MIRFCFIEHSDKAPDVHPAKFIIQGKSFFKIVYSLVVSQHFFQSMQPDLCATGGFSEMMKIFAMASAANIPLIPHVWGTNVGLAAALQLFAGLPHFPERRFPAEPFFEFDRLPHPFREEVTLVKFVMQIGYLDIPQRPGLG
jgi:D-galactarolactone cycloisomerase